MNNEINKFCSKCDSPNEELNSLIKFYQNLTWILDNMLAEAKGDEKHEIEIINSSEECQNILTVQEDTFEKLTEKAKELANKIKERE